MESNITATNLTTQMLCRSVKLLAVTPLSAAGTGVLESAAAANPAVPRFTGLPKLQALEGRETLEGPAL